MASTSVPGKTKTYWVPKEYYPIINILKKHRVNMSRYIMNCLIIKARELEGDDLGIEERPEYDEEV